MAGGPLEAPGALVQVDPLTEVANPLKLALEAPGPTKPLMMLFFHHCAPQNVTLLPTTASRSPITKEVPHVVGVTVGVGVGSGVDVAVGVGVNVAVAVGVNVAVAVGVNVAVAVGVGVGVNVGVGVGVGEGMLQSMKAEPSRRPPTMESKKNIS